jgi:hypothetical protein
MKPLSMDTAEDRTPEPTYGTASVSSSPWTEPSSPHGPCSTGNTTSTARQEETSADGASAAISGSGPSLDRIDSPPSAAATQRPSRAMPTARTS